VKGCNDCGAQIDFRRDGDRWVPVNPDGTDHYMTCTSDRARDKRIRRGQEPGMFPVDPSRIRMYIDCPRAYQRRYIDRIPDEKGPAAHLGIAIHRYAEARLLGLEPPPLVPLEMARDWRMMRDTFDRQFDNDLWDLRDAAVEDRLRWTWQDGEMTVELMVVIDWWRYDDGFVIANDIKSGWGVDHDDGELFKVGTEAELRKSVQGLANILVISKHVPLGRGGRFQEIHLRFGGEIVGADYSPDDLDAFEEILKAHVGRMIRDTEFAPNPFCRVCPPGAHPVEEAAIRPPRTAEEARRLAAYAHEQRRIAAAATEALRPWCAANGPVGTFAHVEHTVRRLAPYVERPAVEEGGEPIRVPGVLEAIRILQEQGQDELLTELVVLSGKKLPGILRSTRKHASVAAALEPLLIAETETKFEERRLVAEESAERREDGKREAATQAAGGEA